MCEIQFIKRIGKELTANDICEFSKLMSAGDLNNHDAFGLFTKGYIFKKGTSYNKKICNDEMWRNIFRPIKTSWIVGHNRFKTQGDAKDNQNNHPFETKNFIVVHNGVINNDEDLKKQYKLNYTEETDSAVIPNLLEYFSSEGDKAVTAIKDVAENLEGSYSVFVYDKRSDDLYYFRNDGSDFSFGLFVTPTGKILMGSTNDENLKEAYFDKYGMFAIRKFTARSIVEAKEGKIYQINDKDVVPVMDFEPVASWYGVRNVTKYSGTYGDVEKDMPHIDEALNTFIDSFETEYGRYTAHNINYSDREIIFMISSDQEKDRMLEVFGFGRYTKKGVAFDFETLYYDMYGDEDDLKKYKEQEVITEYCG